MPYALVPPAQLQCRSSPKEEQAKASVASAIKDGKALDIELEVQNGYLVYNIHVQNKTGVYGLIVDAGKGSGSSHQSGQLCKSETEQRRGKRTTRMMESTKTTERTRVPIRSQIG